jgi:hypothetical protein
MYYCNSFNKEQRVTGLNQLSALGSGYYPGSGPSFWVGYRVFGFTIKKVHNFIEVGFGI